MPQIPYVFTQLSLFIRAGIKRLIFLWDSSAYSSEFVRRDALHSFTLKSQEKVEVCWCPERSIVLKHEDGNLFTVVESINSKLLPGMTVHCERFVKSEPLWLKDIKGDGITEACDYLCGKINGIEYRVL